MLDTIFLVRSNKKKLLDLAEQNVSLATLLSGFRLLFVRVYGRRRIRFLFFAQGNIPIFAIVVLCALVLLCSFVFACVRLGGRTVFYYY